METPCAEDTAYLCAVKSPIPNSFFVHVSILHFPNLSFNSLLDCGPSHCFWLLDGSLARNITHASTISIKFPCGTLLQIRFLLTKLDCDFPAVLGLDWLTLHNPLIDWVRHSVTFQNHINSPLTPPSDPKPSLVSVQGSVTSHPVPSMVSSSDDTRLHKKSKRNPQHISPFL